MAKSRVPKKQKLNDKFDNKVNLLKPDRQSGPSRRLEADILEALTERHL